MTRRRSFQPRRGLPRRPQPGEAALQRIDTLTRTARANWLGLLAYLAYVGVTLMGVEDADFFLPERQTDLPLIGVAVPTVLFFYVAPVLGAMLYVHLHLYLLKLWAALAEAPLQAGAAPLAERITPWVISDMALVFRPGAAPPYALRYLTAAVGLLFIFAAGPVVLGFFFWRSAPKHDPWMTVLACGVPLVLVLFVGAVSLRRMLLAMRRGRRVGTPPLWQRWLGAGTKSLLTLTMAAGVLGLGFAWSSDEWDRLGLPDVTTGLLVPADLRGVDFTHAPPDWRPRDEAFAAFRREMCHADGLSPTLCGEGREFPSSDHPEPDATVLALREAWCAGQFPEDTADVTEGCSGYFEAFEDRVRREWRTVRRAQLQAIRRDLVGVDFRGADLGGARMEGANLVRARMEGAVLRGSRMEGADLSWARMEGANLFEARMEGANLFEAWMEGANLIGARMDADTSLKAATLRGATLRDESLPEGVLSTQQIATVFGDGSVTLPGIAPGGEGWPAHWPVRALESGEFYNELRKWQDDPEGYVPPP